MVMNHAVTFGELLRGLGVLVGIGLLLFGIADFAGGSMSDDPAAGDSAGKSGCEIGIVGLIVIVLCLVACSTPKVQPIQYVDRTVEVDKPVPVHPIKPEDVPALPAPLGAPPPTWKQRAEAALGKLCEFVAYGLTADPMLHTSAGIPPLATEPVYPECQSK